MSLTLFKTATAIIIVQMLAAAVCSGTETVKRVNPHTDGGDCTICHVASADKLRSWFTFGSTKRELKYDLNKACLSCHTISGTHAGGFFGVGTGHSTGKPPAVNVKNLPLAADNTITCAVTCHNVHIKAEDPKQQKNLLRLPFDDLCVSCHVK